MFTVLDNDFSANFGITQEEIEKVIRDFGIEDNEENIWGLMLGKGYLNVVETVDVAKKIYKVKIPNEEIRCLFEEKFSRLSMKMFSYMDVGQD